MIWDGNEYREVKQRGKDWVDAETGEIVEMPKPLGRSRKK